jgi:DNA-binding LytR/AlgR family response regulator
LRFQAERDYVRIYVEGADYLYQETLASLENRLDAADFIRIHRSSIVRRGAITRIKPAPFAALIAVLSDGTEVRIGRTYTSAIRARLIT